MTQLDLFTPEAEAHRAGCQHGRYGPNGEQPPTCKRLATHRAHYHQQAYTASELPLPPPQPPIPARHVPELHSTVDCCREHAAYYANAWATPVIELYPDAEAHQVTSIWVEQL